MRTDKFQKQHSAGRKKRLGGACYVIVSDSAKCPCGLRLSEIQAGRGSLHRDASTNQHVCLSSRSQLRRFVAKIPKVLPERFQNVDYLLPFPRDQSTKTMKTRSFCVTRDCVAMVGAKCALSEAVDPLGLRMSPPYTKPTSSEGQPSLRLPKLLSTFTRRLPVSVVGGGCANHCRVAPCVGELAVPGQVGCGLGSHRASSEHDRLCASTMVQREVEVGARATGSQGWSESEPESSWSAAGVLGISGVVPGVCAA